MFTSVERGSVNGGFTPTEVPHFITKHKVEQHLMDVANKDGITYTILRPPFFLDNLQMGFIGKVIAALWRDRAGSRPMQVIDTRDIGLFAADALLNPESSDYKNKGISLAGDELTFQDANRIHKEKTGEDIPVTFGFLGSILLWLSKDMREMFRFFREQGFAADLEWVRKKQPGTHDFSAWLDSIKKKEN